MVHLMMPCRKWLDSRSTAAFFLTAAALFFLEGQRAATVVHSFRIVGNNPSHHDTTTTPTTTQQQQQQQLLLTNRRNAISSLTTQVTSLLLLEPMMIMIHPETANASFFDGGRERRQKELCLVNLMRLQYWATSVSNKLKAFDDNATADGGDNNNDDEARKRLYLEARLGSKVLVAESKKISGGATANVFMLKGLHLKECLEDLTYYADNKTSKKKVNQYREDLIEAIASIVEFDGLETTQDDSPRSSLTLAMYNSQKSIFVERMLAERIVPLTNDILREFGPEAQEQTEAYMREFYSSEMKSMMSSIPVPSTPPSSTPPST